MASASCCNVVAPAGVGDLAPKLAPYAGNVTEWIAAAAGGLGGMFVQFNGEHAAAMVIRFGHRLVSERGEATVRLTGQAIRSVALGVVVTALAQSELGGIGLAVVGLPFAAVLTALMFVLSQAQIGASVVLVPAIAWMYYFGDSLWATVLVVFTIAATILDTVLRPMLIRRGGQPADAADPRRRHWRADGDGAVWHFHWADGPGDRLHGAECVDARERGGRAAGGGAMTFPPFWMALRA
jgi:hypothetical protein